jgi:hypothetical protein
VAENYYGNVLKPLQIALLQHTASEQICYLFQFVHATQEAVIGHTCNKNMQCKVLYFMCSARDIITAYSDPSRPVIPEQVVH